MDERSNHGRNSALDTILEIPYRSAEYKALLQGLTAEERLALKRKRLQMRMKR